MWSLYAQTSSLEVKICRTSLTDSWEDLICSESFFPPKIEKKMKKGGGGDREKLV